MEYVGTLPGGTFLGRIQYVDCYRNLDLLNKVSVVSAVQLTFGIPCCNIFL